jgi:hypothetical protein
MQPVDCPFCEHANPAGAKFCNECGSPLHFAPCKQCGAVNRIDDSQCFRCGIALNAPPVQTRTAPVDPRAASAAPQEPMGLELKAQWLEQEFLRLREPRAIATEPQINAEKHRAVSPQRPGAPASDFIEHGVGSEPRILAEEHDAISAQRPGESASGVVDHQVGSIHTVQKKAFDHHVDHAATLSTRRRRSLGLARVGLRTRDAKPLFSDLAEAPRVRWREVAAGMSAVILLLAITAGAYYYYLRNVAPNVTIAALGTPEPAAPSREQPVSDMRHASVASTSPLTKDLPAPLPRETGPSAQMVAEDGSEPGEGADRTAAPSSATPTVAAAESSSDAMLEAQCPPAVAAIALCGWFKSHADGK